MNLTTILAALWVLLNLTEILLCAIDKYKAVRHAWRIPEAALLIPGVLGGSIGLTMGMLLFHHKVSKPVFRFGVPAMLLLQIGAVLWAAHRWGIPAIVL